MLGVLGFFRCPTSLVPTTLSRIATKPIKFNFHQEIVTVRFNCCYQQRNAKKSESREAETTKIEESQVEERMLEEGGGNYEDTLQFSC